MKWITTAKGHKINADHITTFLILPVKEVPSGGNSAIAEAKWGLIARMGIGENTVDHTISTFSGREAAEFYMNGLITNLTL